MNCFKMAKVFNVVPKWQKFAKSGHTAGSSELKFFKTSFSQFVSTLNVGSANVDAKLNATSV